MKRVFVCVIIFVIVLICSVARTLPPRNLSVYDVDDNDILKTFAAENIKGFHNCKMGTSGKIEITGEDAYVFFDINQPFGSLKINFADVKQTFQVQVFFDSGTGYSESESLRATKSAGEKWVVLSWNGSNIKRIRIDVDVPYEFTSIELHSSEAIIVPYNVAISWRYFALDVLVSIVVAVLVFVLDKRNHIFHKMLIIFTRTKKHIFIGVFALLVCTFVALVAELVIGCFIVGMSTAGFYFNIYRFVFLVGVFFSIAYLILCLKTSGKKIENSFFGICIILGVMMVVITPFGHNSWDTETHYKWALNASYWRGNAVVTKADNAVMTVDEDTLVKHSAVETLSSIQKINEQYSVYYNREKGNTTIAHYPSGLFIALARLFGVSFYWVFTFGKLANIIVYAFVCYFAIKKLKSGKMILIVIALFPTNLLLATSYSYDYWVTAFGFLGMAYFVGTLQTPEKQISVMETVVMCASFAIAALPKLIYAVLLIIPFFMSKRKMKNPKLYYTICTMTVISMLLMLVIKVLTQIFSGGDMRGGSDVNTAAQLAFIFTQPIHYAKTLIKFLTTYLAVGTMKEYIVNYAYHGLGTGSVIFIILMMVTTLTDKNSFDIKAYRWWTVGAVVVLFSVTAAAIATALYIDFTPVGANTISGCQPRYLIPLLYPLLSVVCGAGIQCKINRKFYNNAVLFPCCLVNLINIATVLLKQWR